MKQKSTNAALAILLGGASAVAPAFAQDAAKPTPGTNLQYVGANTRIGVGVDSDNNVRGEVFQVLRSDDKSATLGEIWAGDNRGGLKLSHHWASGNTAVNKVFAAADQGDNDATKVSLGGGQEYEQWFWNAYLSKGLSGARLGATSVVANTVTQSGTEAGRQYLEDLTTTVTTRTYTRPYDWGVGARAGHFYEAALVRVTAGLDYEWGKYSSRQWTGSLVAEILRGLADLDRPFRRSQSPHRRFRRHAQRPSRHVDDSLRVGRSNLRFRANKDLLHCHLNRACA